MSIYSDDEIHRSCEIGRWVDKTRQAEDAIESEIASARREGMSWAKIGLALGVSAQAAWQRYGLTPEQKRQLRDAQERRFEQLKLDMDATGEVKPGLKPPKRKQRRQHGDR